MSVLLKGHEQIVNELNILYQVMVAEQLIEAKQLKEKIEKQINKIEADQTLSLYYSLLNFKYKPQPIGQTLSMILLVKLFV